MIKASMGKLKIDFNPIGITEQSGFELLDFRAEDALQIKNLPFHHKNPFDRMLIAQNLANNCLIITDDERFNKYECKLI
jgi:PIN domain nuclease of toxin-antitoxin system